MAYGFDEADEDFDDPDDVDKMATRLPESPQGQRQPVKGHGSLVTDDEGMLPIIQDEASEQAVPAE